MLTFALLFVIGLCVVNCQNCTCNDHGVCSQGSCICDQGYTGIDCSIRLSTLQIGETVSGTVSVWSWQYYVITTTEEGKTIRVVMHESNIQNPADCDIYILRGGLPTSYHFDLYNIEWGSEATLLIENTKRDRYYIGIYASFLQCSYTLMATIETPAGSCMEGCLHGKCSNETCTCDPGWTGTTCSDLLPITHLALDSWVSNSVESSKWIYFNIDLNGDYPQMNVVLSVSSQPIIEHDCDIYIKHGELPTLIKWDYLDASITSLVNVTIPNAVRGTWYVGIWGFRQCEFRLMYHVSNAVCISRCSNHGTCGPPCNCLQGYSGTYCQNKTVPLTQNVLEVGYVDKNSWNYYTYWKNSSPSNVIIDVYQQEDSSFEIADVDVYVLLDSAPLRYLYDYMDNSMSKNFSLLIPDVVNRMIYIGMFGFSTIGVGYSFKVRQTTSCLSCVHGTCTDTGICECQPSWSGPACDTELNGLISGRPVSGVVNATGDWIYYRFDASASTVVVTLKEDDASSSSITGFLYLLISEAYEPTLRDYTYMDVDLNKGIHTIQMILDDRVGVTNWVVGVYGSPFLINPVSFQLVMWQPSQA